jgi:hypothetical protein
MPNFVNLPLFTEDADVHVQLEGVEGLYNLLAGSSPLIRSRNSDATSLGTSRSFRSFRKQWLSRLAFAKRRHEKEREP